MDPSVGTLKNVIVQTGVLSWETLTRTYKYIRIYCIYIYSDVYIYIYKFTYMYTYKYVYQAQVHADNVNPTFGETQSNIQVK